MARSTSGLDIAKAGWLYRQSSILHRWKRNWFVLDRQGDLRYFENASAPRAEERIVVRAAVCSVLAGPDCRRHSPPEGVSSVNCAFLELKMREDTLVLCADSYDDMKAWHIALEEARTMLMSNPNQQTFVPAGGYLQPVPAFSSYYTGSYPGQVLSASTPQVFYGPTSTTHVTLPQQVIVVDDDPYRYRHRYGNCRYQGGRFIWY